MRFLVILLFNLGVTVLGAEMYLTCHRPTGGGKRSPKFLRLQDKIAKGVPCDLNTGYCNLPGEHYPWHSVRQFVSENQGMIRRMYGEVRQLSVLRMELAAHEAEILTNQIDVSGRSGEDLAETTQRADPAVSPAEEEVTERTELPDAMTTVYFNDEADNTTAGNHTLEEEPELRAKSTLKAVNACPVKEEVVAPYWANNTRGEILALLNLYPFEQYIHWEKCNGELKQMFCRDGCRCEQQYRLHRLLAFDPTNECRGIFSDWFRFPSCCVCKCYLSEEEIALHYRSEVNVPSSRSPRSQFDFDEDYPDVGGVALDTNFYGGPRK